jgi:hypothetical protein
MNWLLIPLVVLVASQDDRRKPKPTPSFTIEKLPQLPDGATPDNSTTGDWRDSAEVIPKKNRTVHLEQPDLNQKATGRYVIVNPNGTLAVRTTFMLDTATGRCWQWVVDAQGRHSWEEMERWSF